MRIHDPNNPMNPYQMAIDSILQNVRINANIHLFRWMLSIETNLCLDGIGWHCRHTKWLGHLSLELILILVNVKITLGYPKKTGFDFGDEIGNKKSPE